MPYDRRRRQRCLRPFTPTCTRYIASLTCYTGPLLAGILAGVLNTVFALASYPPIWYIERVGRRAMMIWSAIGCGICMLVYVVLTTLPSDKQSSATNWAAVAFIILYEVVFAFGWLGTCWIYGPEVSYLCLPISYDMHSADSF